MPEPVDVPALRRTAFLLCGDWPRADEIVLQALTRAVADRRRAGPAADPAAHLRAELVRCWSADRRPAPEPGPGPGQDLVRELLRMPARRRACVVLRCWAACTAEETARLLGCSTAAVRRETAAGLPALIRLR
jgi:DNA-directed RNA polymerase specialized sigma24 family protein